MFQWRGQGYREAGREVGSIGAKYNIGNPLQYKLSILDGKRVLVRSVEAIVIVIARPRCTVCGIRHSENPLYYCAFIEPDVFIDRDQQITTGNCALWGCSKGADHAVHRG